MKYDLVERTREFGGKIPLISLLLSQSLSLVFLAFLILNPSPAIATTIRMDFQVPIGNITYMNVGPDSIGIYIQAVYTYLVGSVGIIATVVMMYGGILWITAMGNTTQITEAKAWLTAALTGMVIALSSYVILYWVNPDLLNFKTLDITPIDATTNSSGNPSTTSGCKSTGAFTSAGSMTKAEFNQKGASTCFECCSANCEWKSGGLAGMGNVVCNASTH